MSQSEEQKKSTEPPATEGPERELTPEDQARVDEFLRKGVNSVERKPFKPLHLLVILIAIVGGLSLFSQWLAHQAGVY